MLIQKWFAALFLILVMLLTNGCGEGDDNPSVYYVGGEVTGLLGDGLVLENNAGIELPITRNGSFQFPTALTKGSNYAISIKALPGRPNQGCTLSNGSGVIAGKSISNIVVACTADYYTVGGDVTGLDSEGLVLLNNGGDDLAILFIERNNLEKAAGYLGKALQDEDTGTETRAEWYYELAVVNLAIKEYCEAIDAARKAIKLKSNSGKAYILLGDAFIASRENLGDDFKQRTAFWAAADQYQKAGSVDPSVEVKSSQKLGEIAGQYPGSEDVFFNDIKDGDRYLVGGCINENTTVRSGNRP